MSVERAGTGQNINAGNMKFAASLRNGGSYREGLNSPEGIKNAFESLLLGQLLKPIQESLVRSGSVPKGAPGAIYGHFWQTHLSSMLAEQIDMIPGWDPSGAQTAPVDSELQPFRGAASEGISLGGGPGPGLAPGGSDTIRNLSPSDRELDPSGSRILPRIPLPSAVTGNEAASRGGIPDNIPERLRPSRQALAPYEKFITAASNDSGISPNWVRAVIVQESSGRSEAVSSKGAVGLMQLMPTTAAALGVRDAFNPEENIHGGAQYLGTLMMRFGDPRLALAAYNAGPTRVEQYGSIPPFRETQEYVSRVVSLKNDFDQIWPDLSPEKQSR